MAAVVLSRSMTLEEEANRPVSQRCHGRTNTHIYITGLLIECTGADGPRQCWIPALPVQSATQVRVHKKSRALISIMSDSFVCPAMMLTEEVEESVFPRVEIALI